eukprot:1517276-Prymnesium_polylepis.2
MHVRGARRVIEGRAVEHQCLVEALDLERHVRSGKQAVGGSLPAGVCLGIEPSHEERCLRVELPAAGIGLLLGQAEVALLVVNEPSAAREASQQHRLAHVLRVRRECDDRGVHRGEGLRRNVCVDAKAPYPEAVLAQFDDRALGVHGALALRALELRHQILVLHVEHGDGRPVAHADCCDRRADAMLDRCSIELRSGRRPSLLIKMVDQSAHLLLQPHAERLRAAALGEQCLHREHILGRPVALAVGGVPFAGAAFWHVSIANTRRTRRLASVVRQEPILCAGVASWTRDRAHHVGALAEIALASEELLRQQHFLACDLPPDARPQVVARYGLAARNRPRGVEAAEAVDLHEARVGVAAVIELALWRTG